MKKRLFIVTLLVANLLLLIGCSSSSNSISAIETSSTATETALRQLKNTGDLKPTPYKTVNDFSKVTVTVKEGTVSSKGLTMSFKNNSDKSCIYGEEFELEKKMDGEWYRVPVTIEGNYGFNSIGYEVPSEKNGEWTVDWNWLYGSLKPGEYRIVKSILDFKGTGNYDTHFLAAEFTIQ